MKKIKNKFIKNKINFDKLNFIFLVINLNIYFNLKNCFIKQF